MDSIDSGGERTSSDALPPISEVSHPKEIAVQHSVGEALPERIGPYKVLGFLGSGGMGVVYLAEQEKPRRQVALKVMKPGTANPLRLRRFEYEAHVLGRLEHSGIARIYEAGTADTGQGHQPFFAMELIQGQPLTAYANANKLDTRERLGLLIRVCQAVQYAHQQGVIHRDLKPANVLVDKDGQPKVLDFGVARFSADDLGWTTLQTEMGQLIGTMSYMSPEQATADPGQVDWRSDVYTLGVLGYELLAGRLPLDLRSKPAPVAIQLVREEEPAPLGSINKAYRGDLATVVAKALDKDKTRRYQSAQDLAADLERYLRNEPVTARPAGTVYHLRKLAQRNKALVSAAVLLFLALTGGSWLWAVAVLQRERADMAEKEKSRLERDSFIGAARLAGQRGQWREALANYNKAREALANYNKALEASPPDAISLRLSRVRALLAIDGPSGCVSEMEALAGEPDLGEQEGSVLLLQGEILLGREETRAERLIRQAREKNLSPTEEAYSQALLAETTPEAIVHLRRALTLDPYRPRARAILELLLLLLGRLSEARIELSAHEALFPEDTTAKVLRAMLLALEGDRAAADTLLNGQRGPLTNADIAVLQALAKILCEFRNPANIPDPMTGLPDLSRHLLTLAPLFPTLKQAQGAVSNEVVARHQPLVQNFPLPPALRKRLVRVLSVLGEAAGNKEIKRETTDELTRAATVHPEGTIIYLRALTLFAAQRYADAEKAALEAVDTPALFRIQRPAYFLAAASEGMLNAAKKNADLTLRRRALENLRAMLALGPIRLGMQHNIAVNVALGADDNDLARQLVAEWERQQPGDPDPLSYRALIELRAGAYGSAMDAAEKVLQKKPHDEPMLRIKQEAAEKLLEQTRRLLPTGPNTKTP
jgi:tetratricopeptide (TPR) repeat protein/predicted Ser/Thr protein kinase